MLDAFPSLLLPLASLAKATVAIVVHLVRV
jgi:hypothetical protein